MAPKRTICLTIAYDGTGYGGWQRQKNAPTIQGELEDCLARMCRAPVTLHGAGRTDAGVHALAMTASFTTTATIPCAGFVAGLNSMLPAAIRVLAAREAEPGFHARFAAVGKRYRYRIDTHPQSLPTRRLYAWHCPRPLDTSAMERALDCLRGTHDFSSFEAAGSRDRSRPGGRGAVRTLHTAALARGDEADILHLEFHGDGFLRHMVRNMAAAVVEIGLGRLTVDELGAILAARDRSLAPPTAPARGLFLVEVLYPE